MALQAWEREAIGMRPVFIVGAARSGTSILYRSVQSHPVFKPQIGPHLVESQAMGLLPSLRGVKDVRWSPLANFLIARQDGLEALVAVARDIQRLRFRRKVVRRAALRRMDRVALWKAAGEHHVVRRYFLEAHHRRAASRLVEKTPSNLRWVPHLAAAFPQARFLFIIRHPVDTLGSYWKRFKTDPVHPAWADIAPDAFIALWDRVARRAVATAEREPRLLLIRYEDFTLETEPTMRRVLSHVGEEFHEDCLLRDPMSIGQERKGLLRQHPEIRQRFPDMMDPLKRTTKRWEDYVDPALARTVEARLSEPMAIFGYGPKEPSSDDPADV